MVTRRSARLTAKAVREFDPDLIYYWNGAQLSLAVMVAASRCRLPIAYRVCEHWLGGIASYDQFARHLTPGDRGLRLVWARLIRLLNRDPLLRLDSPESYPASISWNSTFLSQATTVPTLVEPLFQEVIYPRDSPGRSVRRGEPADRRPDPRSCSSGASPERRESRSPAEPWRTCAPTTATTPP